MSTPILICAGIAALFLIFALAKIASRLGVIAEYMINIHADLMWFRAKIKLKDLEKGTNPGKQREYWRDQNGFKHWRQKDA